MSDVATFPHLEPPALVPTEAAVVSAPVPSTRPVDVARLSFTLPMMGATVGIIATVLGAAYWIQSDIRDIKTRMELASKLDESNAKLQEERTLAIREAVAGMQRRQELQQYEIQGLKEAITRMEQRR